MGIIPATFPKRLTSETTFSNCLLIVDVYSKIPKLYVLVIITTEEVMDKFDMFQDRFVKIDEFGWWYLERISEDAGTQFAPTEFQDEYQTIGVRLKLAASDRQEINKEVKVTWITLRKIAHSLMVHAQVLEAYIHFTFMYRADHIFPVLPIKDLINKDGDPTMPFKLSTGKKPSI